MKLLDRAARRLLDRVRLPVAAGATATRQGGHRSPILATGIEFADHRAYIPGDDIRHIDWKAFSRHGHLTIRQFEEERDARIYVLLDASASMSCGEPSKMELARRLAAAFAYVGMRQFDRATIIPFGDGLGARTRSLSTPAELPELDRFLREYEARGGTEFVSAVRSLGARFPRRGSVIVISDLMKPDGFDSGFRSIASLGHQLRLIQIRSRYDLEPDLRGEIELVDIEASEGVRLRVSRDLLSAYRREVESHFAACRDAVRRVGGLFVGVDAEMSFELAIRRSFAGAELA